MSLEMLRFGWQKLLVNQVPQKGGRGGPPPPDYAGQWNAAQAAFNRGVQVVEEVRSTYGAIAANPTTAPALIEANNNKLNTEIGNLNNIINQTSGIPDYIFGTSDISKPEAINILTAARDNMARCLTTVPPPPPPPIPVPPPTIRIPAEEYLPQQPVVVSGAGQWVLDGNPDGVGTYTGGVVTGLAAMVWADDGNSYPSPSAVPAGRRWSYKRWRWQPANVDIPPPPPPPPPPSALEILQIELGKQTDQLRRINRIMNKPIDPAPPENIYPTTSWQYEFWNKGYSLLEISYAEDQAAQRGLLDSSNGDFALFKARVEDLLQDSILAGSIPPAISQEIIRPPVCGLDENGRSVLPPPLPVNPMPYQPDDSTFFEPPFAPMPLPPCQLPMPYVDRNGVIVDSKLIPTRLRRQRVFQSRGVRNRPIDIKDLPDVPTICPSVMPRVDNWEDSLIGAGATISELDTVRRTIARTKFAPNANRGNVAKNMLATLRGQVGATQGQGQQLVAVYDGNGNAIPPQQPVLFGANSMNNIPGVQQVRMNPVTMVKSNAIAQRKAQQARRGALNSRTNRK